MSGHLVEQDAVASIGLGEVQRWVGGPVEARDLLDSYADDSPAVPVTYRRAMQLEVAFFEAALGA